MDTELSPVGVDQANLVGDRLKNIHFDAIFTSDLKRAADTAEAIKRVNKQSSFASFTSPLMRERNFGFYNGKPREQIHRFIAETKAHQMGCQMWRDCRGECSHEVGIDILESRDIFWRALNFFFDLCEFAANQEPRSAPEFPSQGSTELPEYAEPLPLLLPLRQPPVPQAFVPPIRRTDEDVSHASSCTTGTKYQNMDYVGHFILVGHGQWIREFNHILHALAEQHQGFPLQRRMIAVLENCQFNQFGVAFGRAQLALRASHIRAVVESAIATNRQGKCKSLCPYELRDFDRLPISTVCYHLRLDADSVCNHLTTGSKVADNAGEFEEVVPSAGTGVETLYFAREDDEYAGLPLAK
ncbi:unnamed protein product [Mesocestoides corti]|uniref:Phosphoglycerate mutase n=1 Tax=Mesocestoides corti TaxID=53468 RepID=A0A0R3U6H7_MESCO|nr:unnamed protein product [Mesocestoides corti]